MSGDEEEVAILAAEIDRLKKVEEERTQPNWFVLLWRRLFGVLVYGGPRTCGHCVYWKRPKRQLVSERCGRHHHGSNIAFYGCTQSHHWVWVPAKDKGDCKLIYGVEDTSSTDSCDRFRARRRYKHRVRYDSWVAKGQRDE